MTQMLKQEFKHNLDCDAEKLEMAKRLLNFLNAHVMSDEGVRKTSFQKVSRN